VTRAYLLTVYVAGRSGQPPGRVLRTAEGVGPPCPDPDDLQGGVRAGSSSSPEAHERRGPSRGCGHELRAGAGIVNLLQLMG